MTQPQPVTAPRALGLVRVSREGGRGERLLSPDIQRAAIEEYCDRRGYDVVDYVIAIDESGSRKKSSWWARLDQTIERVEAGQVDVIVAWEFSRAARNRLRWAVALDRVESAGGRLESATEPVDTTTAAGRFQRGMLAEMHAYKAEQIGEAWKEVHRNRVARGLPPTGGARFGYQLVDGTHQPDPETGPVLAELYRRAVRGDSLMSLAEWMNDTGIHTTAGGTWTRSRIRPILDSGFGAGRIAFGGEYLPGAHQPVVDDDTWAEYLQARQTPSRPAQNAARYPLTGLLVCGDCGSGMSITTRTVAGRTEQIYGCNRYQRHRVGRYVTTKRTRIEEWVKVELQVFAADLARATEARAKLRARRTASVNDAGVIARKVEQLDRKIQRAVDGWTSGLLTDDEYQSAVGRYRDDRQKLLQRRAVLHQDANTDDRAVEIAASLVTDWERMRPAALRSLLAVLIESVTVTPPDPPGSRSGATYAIRWRFDD